MEYYSVFFFFFFQKKKEILLYMTVWVMDEPEKHHAK